MSAELLIGIAKEARDLKPCALHLLIHLIALANEEKVNPVCISRQELCLGTGMARESVDEGTRGLKHLMEISDDPGRIRRYLMPPNWFTFNQLQPSLFPEDPVEKLSDWPKIQAGKGENPGHYPPGIWAGKGENPGHHPPGIWAGEEKFQAAKGENPGHTRLESGPLRRNSRPHPPGFSPHGTQNQQLTNGAVDRSIEGLIVGSSICSIDEVKRLPLALHADGQELRLLLRDYTARHHPTGTVPDGPDEQIQAKCLAVAPLATLTTVLRTMDQDRTPCNMKAWPYWVTTFCQRLRGTKKTHLVSVDPTFRELQQREEIEQQNPKAPPPYEMAAAKPAAAETQIFGPKLVDQVVAAGKHKL